MDLYVLVSRKELRGRRWAQKLAIHDYYPVRPVDAPPSKPMKADEAWKKEYAKYTSEYRMRYGLSAQCGWCYAEVTEWDTSYDGWNRCPYCGGN